MVENLKEWLYLIAIIGSSLLTVLGVVLTILSKSKNSKVAAASKKLLFLTNNARVFIAQAEQIANFTGIDKKEWVMTKLNQTAIENNITFDATAAGKIVEELIEFSNKVNTNKPLKVETEKAVEIEKAVETEVVEEVL